MNQFPKSNTYLTSNTISYIQKEIKEAGGNEVLFLGVVNSDKKVTSARVIARGNINSAPAILREVRSGSVLIHNHPSGHLQPSDADIQIASIIGEGGAGFFIINNDADNIYCVIPPFTEEKETRLNVEKVLAQLKAGSKLAESLEGYEERDEQLKMVEEVVNAFNDQKIALVEAGTGVGKSIAYLIPSILWALKSGERVVISTNTINLQEQLIYKDIPFLQNNMSLDFKAILVKGRGNYACKRKGALLIAEGNYLFEDQGFGEDKALLNWLEKTKEGSRSDLNFVPRNSSWEKIASERDLCLRARCSFYDKCFFYGARREAASSQILVANHHLLFADISVKGESGSHNESAVLPPFKRVIIDEAHNVEDVATEYFGGEVSKRGTLLTLSRLANRKDKKKGLIPYLYQKLSLEKKTFSAEGISKAKEVIDKDLLPSLSSLEKSVPEFFDYAAFTAVEMKNGNNRKGDEGSANDNKKIRLTDDIKDRDDWKEIEKRALLLLQKSQSSLKALIKLTDIIKEGMDDEIKEHPYEPQLLELKAYTRRVTSFMTMLETFFFNSPDGVVRWIDLTSSSKGLSVKLHLSPLSIAEKMYDKVYKTFKTIVMTSATLSVAGKFNYTKERIGLNLLQERFTESLLASPFNYEKQVFVGIPTDLSAPTEAAFSDDLIKIIPESLEISEGRAFVLFTSYKLLNSIFDLLSFNNVSSKYKIMKQGDLPRHILLNSFKSNINSVIFGSDSFWEGVDVPGDALSNVIITKLPFSVPDTPIIEARTGLIEKMGGNAFMEYILPQAILRFKQGFGRLIRNKSDRGSVLILDSRIVNKSYGRLFLKSLPTSKVCKENTESILLKMKDFFDENLNGN